MPLIEIVDTVSSLWTSDGRRKDHLTRFQSTRSYGLATAQLLRLCRSFQSASIRGSRGKRERKQFARTRSKKPSQLAWENISYTKSSTRPTKAVSRTHNLWILFMLRLGEGFRIGP
jgi:hypothetical protein